MPNEQQNLDDGAGLARLQELIDRSTASATASIADSVAFAGRQMTAAEFVEFWRGVRLVAMCTVGAAGQPHIAPVHAQLGGGRFGFGPGRDSVDPSSDLTVLRMVVYEDAVRRSDLARNPRVAISTWRDDGAAAILYGRAREVPGSLRPARAGRSGKPRQVVELAIQLSRIYAMRPPEKTSE
jgi:pyridoxamine 5'-phosphate oxidase-like protein